MQRIKVSKQLIMKAKKEDLKAVWEATSEFGDWETDTVVVGMWGHIQDNEDTEMFERVCSGACVDDTGYKLMVCRYKDQRDENGKIVDCGFKRLEEIWSAGQKSLIQVQ